MSTTKQGLKLTDIKGKGYVEVNERIRYFRENYTNLRLISNLIKLEDGICVFEAQVVNESGEILANGHAYEREGSTFINKTSYIENCETSAWGRALANFGIGLDTSIASAEEVQNAIMNQSNEPKTYKTWSKASDEEKDAYKREFIKECEAYGLKREEIKDFFDFINPSINEKEAEKHNTIVQFLKGDYLEDQIRSYEGFKEFSA